MKKALVYLLAYLVFTVVATTIVAAGAALLIDGTPVRGDIPQSIPLQIAGALMIAMGVGAVIFTPTLDKWLKRVF